MGPYQNTRPRLTATRPGTTLAIRHREGGHREPLLAHWPGRIAAGTVRHRGGGGPPPEDGPPNLNGPGQLYDLAADPGEQKNLFSARPDIVRQLTQGLAPEKRSD